MRFRTQKETQIYLRYGIEVHISAIPDLEGVDNYELKSLTEDFLELQQDLTKLQWFSRANQHALYKVYTKLEKFSEAIGQSYHDQKSRWLKSRLECETQILKDVERFNKLVDDVRLACSRVHHGSACRSLYLNAITNILHPSAPVLHTAQLEPTGRQTWPSRSSGSP